MSRSPSTPSGSERPTCCYCNKPDDFPADPNSELRPYGPQGAWVCFGCMVAAPEREAEAKKQFSAALDAAGPVALIDTRDNIGVRPFKNPKDQQ